MSKSQNYIHAGEAHGLPDLFTDAPGVRGLSAQARRVAQRTLLKFGRRAAERGRALGYHQQRSASRWRAVAHESRRAARLL